MSNNPFSSDYVAAPLTQAAIAHSVPADVGETPAVADSPVAEDIEKGFRITPIPMVSGKPRRVIIRGKVTRD